MTTAHHRLWLRAQAAARRMSGPFWANSPMMERFHRWAERHGWVYRY